MSGASLITYQPADVTKDFDFARLVHHSAYRDVVIRQFGSWDESLQDTFFIEKWKNGSHQFIVFAGERIGCLSVEYKPECVYLNELQILPEHQGKGLGSLVLRELQEKSRKLKLPLRLQVLRENYAAALYKRHGFVERSQTDTHILMEWKSLSE